MPSLFPEYEFNEAVKTKVCTVCGKENTRVLEGMGDFFV